MKYTYKCILGAGSGKPFIRFIHNWKEAGFYADLLSALKDVNPTATCTTPESRRCCDEYNYLVQTDIGNFELEMIWESDEAKIYADTNQQGILKIDTILNDDTRFERLK